MKRLLLPIILVLVFYSESFFVDFFPENAFGLGKTFVPHFLLVTLLLMAIYYFQPTTYVYAAIFGLIFDVYFTEVIGIYLCLFLLATYFAAMLSKLMRINFFSVGVIVAICLAIVEMAVYLLHILIFRISIPFEEFVNSRLYSTLILNLLFLFIVFYPFSRMFMKNKKVEIKE